MIKFLEQIQFLLIYFLKKIIFLLKSTNFRNMNNLLNLFQNAQNQQNLGDIELPITDTAE